MYSSTTTGEMPGLGEMPTLVTRNGIPWWEFPNGRTFRAVAGGEDPPAGDDHNDDDDADEEQFDKDRALATIRKQRERERAQAAELKIAKQRAAELEAKERERQEADKSELERAQAKLAEREQAHREAEARLQRVLISTAIERAARKYNARNPEVVAKLIDQSKLELDSDGEPTNAEQLVKDLLKAEPYLVTDGKAEGSSGVPPTPRSNGSATHDDRVKAASARLAETGEYAPL